MNHIDYIRILTGESNKLMIKERNNC